MISLRLATWNINGALSSAKDIEYFIKSNQLDAVLLSESHMSDDKTLNIPGFLTYNTPHPNGKSQGGAAIIINKRINHFIQRNYTSPHLQAATVTIEDKYGLLDLSAVYCPPRHNISDDMFNDFFSTLGPRFVSGGDWNAKNTYWGSRLTLTRGKNLKKSIDFNHLTVISTGEPTYWPSDMKKTPDLVDFFVTKGINNHYMKVESSLDGSSDHSPVLLTISSRIINITKPETLSNNHTDWEGFKQHVASNINLNIPLKTTDDVDEACFKFTNLMQVAVWKNTPEEPFVWPFNTHNIPNAIKQKIAEKRRLRATWHNSRLSSDKAAFNKASKDLKKLIKEHENITFNEHMASLLPYAKDNHSLWKATKTFKRPQLSNPPIRMNNNEWARTDYQKAETFAKHLSLTFQPNDGNNIDEEEIDSVLQQPFQLDLPLRHVRPEEVRSEIKKLDSKKAPGYDLVTPKILKELPNIAIIHATQIFNATYRLSYYPQMWKVSQIVMIPKPGKANNIVTSYRPISLLPVLSKLWEKLFLKRLKSVLNSIPDHQFGFREGHSTVEQAHRIYFAIRESLERKKYCSAAFLDIQQAFDKVWHKGLLYKVKQQIPHIFLPLIQSYLSDRLFQVKHGQSKSSFYDIKAGVPQGSVLGPVLYNIFTADLPQSPNAVTATFADDTAILASDESASQATIMLQEHLDKTKNWLSKWRIRISASKSTHITFALRRGDCPPVRLGDEELPHKNSVKYLGFTLDRRLTWKAHVKAKRAELDARFKSLYWLLGPHSRLHLENKLLVYQSIIKPVWTYGIQIWCTASKSNMAIIQRAQNKILRTLANVPWFVTNKEIHEYLEVPSVDEEIKRTGRRYLERLKYHVNPLAQALRDPCSTKRLKRRQMLDYLLE